MGVNIRDIFDLVNYNFDYRSGVPVLLDWLPRMENLRVHDAIVRALTVKFAAPAAVPAMLHEFECGLDYSRWAAGNALGFLADRSILDDLLRLAKTKKFGTARQEVAYALWRFKEPRVVAALVELLKDDDVAGHALSALGRMNAVEARPAIEPFLTHANAWWRKTAKKAIAKFDKAATKRI